jgi:hypothetical protein
MSWCSVCATSEFEGDEISVRSVVFCARGSARGIERRRVGFRETCWRGCGDHALITPCSADRTSR